LFDYTAQQSNELSVQRGVRVTILSSEDPQWWRGQIDNQEGYIPASYVALEDITSVSGYVKVQINTHNHSLLLHNSKKRNFTVLMNQNYTSMCISQSYLI